jgi:GrpB-like predicted nucleotidyltransferase (UPF0157 family)
MWKPVIVVDYDPAWAATFEVLRKQVAGVLGETVSSIEHVGSTAVPGLAAKPIIDIDVLLASETMLPEAIERLSRLGYVHQGDLGIPEREAFLTPAGTPAHHLYVRPPHSREFQRHLAFRDYLRAHPTEAKAYGDLKKALASQFRDDREAYMAGKHELVGEILTRAMTADNK